MAMLVKRPVPVKVMRPVGDRSLSIQEETETFRSFDFITRLGGTPGGSPPLSKEAVGSASLGTGTGRLRKSATANSIGTDASKVSYSSERLRARHQPKFRRCGTALSSLSALTGNSDKSSVPPELEIGALRGIHSVSFTTQWSFDNDYELGNKLGEGGYGQVWHCTHRETQHCYAVKVIPGSTIKDVQRFEREHKVFERLNNPYVVRLHEIFCGSNDVYLVMDLCLGGDLMDYCIGYWGDRHYPDRMRAVLENPQCALGLPWKEAAQLIWQMLSAVAYLHHHRFCHRDVKPENYMIRELSETPHVQLCDFGLSMRFERGQMMEGKAGTMMYIAPEVLLEVQYSEKCDIWSVGVCGYVISTMLDPWGANSDKQEVQDRIKANDREPFPEDKPKELQKLINSLMVLDPLERPSAKEVFRTSAWLRKHGRSMHQAMCAGCALS